MIVYHLLTGILHSLLSFSFLLSSSTLSSTLTLPVKLSLPDKSATAAPSPLLLSFSTFKRCTGVLYDGEVMTMVMVIVIVMVVVMVRDVVVL